MAIESKSKQLEHFEKLFGILTASLKGVGKLRALKKFRRFYSFKFGEVIVPQISVVINLVSLAAAC